MTLLFTERAPYELSTTMHIVELRLASQLDAAHAYVKWRLLLIATGQSALTLGGVYFIINRLVH